MALWKSCLNVFLAWPSGCSTTYKMATAGTFRSHWADALRVVDVLDGRKPHICRWPGLSKQPSAVDRSPTQNTHLSIMCLPSITQSSSCLPCLSIFSMRCLHCSSNVAIYASVSMIAEHSDVNRHCVLFPVTRQVYLFAPLETGTTQWKNHVLPLLSQYSLHIPLLSLINIYPRH